MSKTPSAVQKAECWPGLWQFNPRYKLKAANGGVQNGLLAGGVWQRATIAAEKQRLCLVGPSLCTRSPPHPRPGAKEKHRWRCRWRIRQALEVQSDEEGEETQTLALPVPKTRVPLRFEP